MEYEYEVDERVAIMVEDGGVSEADARASAAEEFGCLEFFDFTRGRQFEPHVQNVGVVALVPADRTLLCSRCESIGHLLVACPFAVDDVGVLRIAEARRALRGEKAA